MKKKYSLDIHWDVAKNFVVEAESMDEAYRILNERLDKGEFSCWDSGWEATDDVEIIRAGEEGPDGEIEYY